MSLKPCIRKVRHWGWIAYLPDNTMHVRTSWERAMEAVREWYAAPITAQEAE